MTKEQRPSIFKRILAFLIDFILLGILGFLLSLFLEDFFVSLGEYGSLFGTFILILYFGIMQSGIGEGRSLGKRAINAKVTDLYGRYLSLGSSLLRATILYLPFTNIRLFSGGLAGVVIMSVLVLMALALIYLLLVNKSRRSLHDLLVGSMVVHSSVSDPVVDKSRDLSKKKLLPFAAFVILFLGVFIYQATSGGTLSQLVKLKSAIEEVPGVLTVNEIKSSVTTNYSDETSSTVSSIKVNARIADKTEATDEDSQYFETINALVHQHVTGLENYDEVEITLSWGYDIVIFSRSRSITKTFTR